ncbi:unnamed protein product [Prorocentrum cordatum]|uniref:Uncharacterized protein n=1 Tax=Prorocentrum cordatum TaxID=2364126 RepID=A0ABN9UX77_9DINO|nr:unnamed protein product [Polarella glacialis]
MPSSSKGALERKRADDMNRARMQALKTFLSRPWVKQTLHDALKESKHASSKRLRNALADVPLQSNARYDELQEKAQKAQDQGEQVKQLPKENQRLLKESK